MDKKITLEHAIKNIVRESIGGPNTDEFKGTPKAFLKPAPLIAPKKGDEHPDGSTALSQRGRAKIATSETMKEEEEISEAYVGGQKSLKPTEKQKSDMETNLKNLPAAADAAARGFASSATFGAADHVAAAGDYLAKNAAWAVGLGKGTTYDKEYKQEQEKTERAQKEHPTAYTAGEWAPLALGGAKAAVSAAKAAPAVIKAIPGAIKDFAKSYAKTTPIDTVKAVGRSLGGDIISNPVKYAKEIPSTAKGMAKFGGGLEVADKSVGMPELVGGQGWKKGAIYDQEKRKEMFSPGGGTKAIQDVGTKAAEMAAPGSVEAGKAAAQGDWDKAGKEATKAVVGAALVNPNLGRFVYDAAASAVAPKYSLTGEGGVSDRIYNKIKKIKESKKNLDEGNAALETPIKLGAEWLQKAVAEKIAKAAAEKVAKEAGTNIVRPEFPSSGAAKPKPKKPSPDKTEPGREGKPYVDKPANQPGGPNVTPFKAPEYTPPYKPGKDFPNLQPPANPGGKPPIITPNPKMPPPGQDPFRVSPPEKIPGKDVPPPVKPTGPETTPPAPAKPDVKTPAPELPVDPRINPKIIPDNKPIKTPEAPKPETKPEPFHQPVHSPGEKLNPAPKIEPWHQPEPRVNPEGALRRLPKEEKPAKKEEPKKEEKPPKKEKPKEEGKSRKFPWLPSFSVNDMTVAGMTGYVPNAPHLHRAADRATFGESASEERTSIENVARPRGKTRIGKQGQIRTKIIDENVKKASLIKRVIADKKNSIVDLHPKLKTPEADQN